MDDNVDYTQLEFEDSAVSSPAQQDFLSLQDFGVSSRKDHASISVRAKLILKYYVTFPIAVLGIPANLVVLWVWSSEPGYHPTTYLFKAQALTDGLCLITYLLRAAVSGTVVKHIVFFSLTQAYRRMGVQVTMLLAVVRVIRVFFPFHSEKLLSRFRMKLVLAGFAVFNLTVAYLYRYMTIASAGKLKATAVEIRSVITMLIPSALQIVFMIAVMWRRRGSFRIKPSSTRRTVHFKQDKEKARRLVCTVFAMCLFTFIPHFVGQCVMLLVGRRTYREGEFVILYRLLVNASFDVFSKINLSINIVLYYYLIVKFKVLVSKKFQIIREDFKSKSQSLFMLSSSGSTSSSAVNAKAEVGQSTTQNQGQPHTLPGCSSEMSAYAEIASSTGSEDLKEDSASFNTSIS